MAPRKPMDPWSLFLAGTGLAPLVDAASKVSPQQMHGVMQAVGIAPPDSAPVPGETNGDALRRHLSAWAPAAMNLAAPGSGIAAGALTQGLGAVNSWSKAVAQPVAAAAAAPPHEPFDLSPWTASTEGAPSPAAGGLAGPHADPHVDPAGFFQSVVGAPVQIISGLRSAKHNRDVGGVDKSQHLADAQGRTNAWDIAVPGMTGAQLAERIRAAGVPYHQLIIEGNTVHYGFPEGQNDGQYMLRHGPAGPHASYTRLNGPLVDRNADPYTAAPVESIDPQTAMSFVPNPVLAPYVHLPTPPAREAPIQPTPLEQVPDSILDPLIAAERDIKNPAKPNDAWQRVASALGGAATAAAALGRAPTVGELLLAMGGGAQRGFRSEADKQDAEQERYHEMVRQANVALAQAGMNVKLDQLATRNMNTKQMDAWRNDVVANNNLSADQRFQVTLQEALSRHQTDLANTGEINQTNRARGSVGASAYEGSVQARNAATATQQELNIRRQADVNSGVFTENKVRQLLGTVGVPPQSSGRPDPVQDNAREGARYMVAGNLNDALGALGREIVLAADYKNPQIVQPAMATRIDQFLREKPPNYAAAAALVSSSLAGNHAQAAAIAKALAGVGGHPMASLLAQRVK